MSPQGVSGWRLTSDWQIYCCQVWLYMTRWHLMWPDVGGVTRSQFLDISVTLTHFDTISCILWPGGARNDQKWVDIVFLVVTKCCQLWPGIIKSDQIKALMTRKWLSITTMKNHIFTHIFCLDRALWMKMGPNDQNIASVFHVKYFWVSSPFKNARAKNFPNLAWAASRLSLELQSCALTCA